MEVIANGFKANFWVPIEEEPDIDRFIDEQIMIDMDRFMLVGTLEKVATCKKKNEEKEYEYFKQITVQVNNICSAADNNINIQIPGKKDEFLYDVKFRYAPEPEQVAGDDMEEVAETEIEQIESDAEALDIDAETDEILGNETPDAGSDDEQIVPDAEKKAGPEATPEDAEPEAEPNLSDDEIDALFDEDGSPANELKQSGADAAGAIDGTDDDDFSFENEPACNAIIDPEEPDADSKPDSVDNTKGAADVDGTELPDDEGIDWGD